MDGLRCAFLLLEIVQFSLGKGLGVLPALCLSCNMTSSGPDVKTNVVGGSICDEASVTI